MDCFTSDKYAPRSSGLQFSVYLRLFAPVWLVLLSYSGRVKSPPLRGGGVATGCVVKEMLESHKCQRMTAPPTAIVSPPFTIGWLGFLSAIRLPRWSVSLRWRVVARRSSWGSA